MPDEDFNALRMTQGGKVPASIWNRLLRLVKSCQITSVIGGRYQRDGNGTALIIDRAHGNGQPPKLWHVELADLVLDPFSIAAKVLEDAQAAWGGAIPSEGDFAGIVDPLFAGLDRESGAPGSVAPGLTALFGSLSAVVTSLADDVAAVVDDMQPIAGTLSAYFADHGSMPQDGDYVYTAELGIAYVLFRQQVSPESGQTIPTGNSIFRVRFDVQLSEEAAPVPFVALTTFPAPDIFGLLESILSFVLSLVSGVLANGLSALAGGIFTGILSGLNALFTELEELIDQLVQQLWDAINAIPGFDPTYLETAISNLQTGLSTLQGQVANMQTALDALDTALEALNAVIDGAVNVSVIGADGSYHTLKVLQDTAGGSAEREITWIDSETGTGQRSSFLVKDGAAAPANNIGDIDWRRVDYIHPDGTTYKITALVRAVDNEPLDDATYPNFALAQAYIVEDGVPVEKRALVTDPEAP